MLDQLLTQASLPAAIYTHIPFCKSKCTYCDFGSKLVAKNSAELANYTERVIIKIGELGFVYSQLYSDVSPVDRSSPTLYIGGGTPSHLGAGLLAQIAAALQQSFNPARAPAEFTVELNPESTSSALLAAIKQQGVNRLSLGIQSFNDQELATVKRAHTSQQATDAIKLASEYCDNISIDLIVGLPNQTESSWKDTLQQTLGLINSQLIQHVSIYPLALEESTPLAKSVHKGTISLPDLINEDFTARMWQEANVQLQAAGLEHYEISSWALPGYRSKHNQHYWDGSTYWGIGDGASGMLNMSKGQYARTRYKDDAIEEQLTAAESAKEDVMLAFRCKAGVDTQKIEQLKGYYPQISIILDHLFKHGLIETNNTGYHASAQGWLLGNELFSAIWNLV